ncbi:MAG: hypothetical protein EXS36_11415 [Pedosphaera sp.]|nr:hypothetical protein [Pedosphaera sp.]
MKSEPSREPLFLRHLRLGWGSLLLFLTLGLVLEGLHGFKVGAYLDLSNHTRRLMWTLAHAHGTLLGLVHLGFAATLAALGPSKAVHLRAAAGLLTSGGILIPAGFFLGGIWIHSGDPGLGILLLPVGAVCLFASILITALRCR